jgi:transcriptional regulator with XRE-family HTH domain
MAALNLSSLGRHIRAARVARRLTLEDVVSRTEFTVSWLSKIENGLLAPSLEGLVRLAEALECGVEDFVAGLSTPPRFVVDRAGEGRQLQGRNGSSGTVVRPLAEAWRQRVMQPEIIQLSGSSNRRPAESHEGEQFLHVLEGEVKVAYGDDVVRLGKGDSMYLDAAVSHSITPSGRGATQILSVSFEPQPNGNGKARNGRSQRNHRGTGASSRSGRD